MLRKGAFTAKHFDDDPAMSFKLFEEDPLSRQVVRPFDFGALFPAIFRELGFVYAAVAQPSRWAS